MLLFCCEFFPRAHWDFSTGEQEGCLGVTIFKRVEQRETAQEMPLCDGRASGRKRDFAKLGRLLIMLVRSSGFRKSEGSDNPEARSSAVSCAPSTTLTITGHEIWSRAQATWQNSLRRQSNARPAAILGFVKRPVCIMQCGIEASVDRSDPGAGRH